MEICVKLPLLCMSNEKQVEYNLFRLFHVEKDIQKLNEDLISKQQEVKAVEVRKEQADEVLREKKKEYGKITRELAKIQQEMREFETQMNKKRPLHIKAKEKVTHCQKKLASLQKTLETAREADNAHQHDVEKLEKQLAEVEAMKKRFEDDFENDSQKRGKNKQMEDGLVQEYDRLKQKAEATATQYRSQLDSVNREQKSDQDLLDSETNRKASVEENYKKITLQREEAVKRRDKLMDHIKSSKAALEEQNRIKEELREDVEPQQKEFEANNATWENADSDNEDPFTSTQSDVNDQFVKVKIQPKSNHKSALRKPYENEDTSDSSVISSAPKPAPSKRNQSDEYDLLGKRIAAHFRNMDDEQSLIAEKVISEVCFYGRMKLLTMQSGLNVDASPVARHQQNMKLIEVIEEDYEGEAYS